MAYDVDGVRHDEMPMTQTEFHHAKPIYEYLDGWWEDISGCRDVRRPAGERPGLRARARGDVRARRIWGVGVGPGREQTLVVPALTLARGRPTAARSTPRLTRAAAQRGSSRHRRAGARSPA